MTKPRRGTQTAYSETASLRIRAAWLYYNHGLTQKDVAQRLGVSRTTVISLLDEALKRNEVRIWIDEGEASCVDLASRLEHAFDLDQAIVVPEAPTPARTPHSVGAALGQFLSESITDHVTVGVGWGRTLTASLASFRPVRREGVRILSLLGGTVEAQFTNPVEYSWRLASQLDAECFLFPAPLIVDSRETKRLLIEKCGLDRLFRLSETLDMAVVSVGDIGPDATSITRHLMSQDELDELVALGCVADVMCNFLDAEGGTIAHPLSERVMSVGLDAVRQAGYVVIASGGRHRAAAIRAAILRLGCDALVTDEGAARIMLDTLAPSRPAKAARAGRREPRP